MKIPFNAKKILYFLSLVVILSCKRDPILLEMINSSDKDIKVSLEEMPTFTLRKNTFKSVPLQPGVRKVKFDDGEEISFNLQYKTKILLNPAKGNIYEKYINYASDKMYSEMNGGIRNSNYDSLVVGGYKIQGPYGLLGNDVVLKGDWSFGLNESVPSSIEIKED